MTDPTQATELDMVVGALISVHPDEDRAAFEEEQEMVAAWQDTLRQAGVQVDLLAHPGTEVWEGGIETIGSLYQLSRLATHLERGDDITGVLEDGPVIYDDLDPAVTDVWDGMVKTRFPHLVNLQGVGSYYLPVDFAEPVIFPAADDEAGEDEEDEVFFGSSVQLQRELTDLADLLQQARIPSRSAAYRCMEVLREAAAQSLRYNLPIIVW